MDPAVTPHASVESPRKPTSHPLGHPARPQPTSPATVLLVDDEPQVRQLIAQSLEQAGYRVLEATGGMEALRLLDSCGADVRLVISDLRMPGLDGYELAERITARPHAPPILFMSGYGQEGVWLPGPLLPKPFQLDALTAEVRRLLAG
jgi:CheY-like chemotaxis protein